ncbi:MAG: hypothetical protein KME36_10885 [Candidatus Thiodiazotropha sp. (ex Lucina pensylvanica)]|nr:hypothetical protein [Candidatus Thiodiazotropha sp. (ex Lucina pensylvanica)]MBT3050684.1 hypothetical protein [Candidatus Thiodiazotropha sp. (ex Codakia orbicularis)]
MSIGLVGLYVGLAGRVKFHVRRAEKPNNNNKLRILMIIKLEETIHKNQIYLLEKHGNKLSDSHKEGLRRMAEQTAAMLIGGESGRFAFDAPTGAGKTTTIIATILAVEELGLDLSIVVAQEKIEGLCDTYRSLEEMGVPVGLIGLIHSKKDGSGLELPLPATYASLPATPKDEWTNKKYILMSHQMLRGQRNLKEYWYRGRSEIEEGAPRDLLFYDETLWITNYMSDNYEGLVRDIYDFQRKAERETKFINPHTVELAGYLGKCRDIIDRVLISESEVPVVISLPPVDVPYEHAVTVCSGKSDTPLMRFLDHCNCETPEFRLEGDDNTTLISYDTAIPAELDKIIALDASIAVRYAATLNDTIQHKPSGIEFDYSNVTIHYARTNGGKGFIDKEFKGIRVRNRLINEILDLIRSLPEHDKVLIFSHKDKPGLDIVRQIKDSVRDVLPLRSDNILFETYGNETASNHYAECKHVILAGMLEKPVYTHQAMYLSESENLFEVLNGNTVNAVKYGEIFHTTYQAVSRGNLRHIDNGKAGEMNIWMFHNYPNQVK